MDTRTTSETIVMGHAFRLRAADAPLPAGRYVVNREEEALDRPSFQAWRCTQLTITRTDGRGLRQALPLSPAELDALRAAP